MKLLLVLSFFVIQTTAHAPINERKLQTGGNVEPPTASPIASPSTDPSSKPSAGPTEIPSNTPSEEPTVAPSSMPSVVPTAKPTVVPAVVPTDRPRFPIPAREPTSRPVMPTSLPTNAPSIQISNSPSEEKVLYVGTVKSIGMTMQGDFNFDTVANEDKEQLSNILGDFVTDTYSEKNSVFGYDDVLSDVEVLETNITYIYTYYEEVDRFSRRSLNGNKEQRQDQRHAQFIPDKPAKEVTRSPTYSPTTSPISEPTTSPSRAVQRAAGIVVTYDQKIAFKSSNPAVQAFMLSNEPFQPEARGGAASGFVDYLKAPSGGARTTSFFSNVQSINNDGEDVLNRDMNVGKKYLVVPQQSMSLDTIYEELDETLQSVWSQAVKNYVENYYSRIQNNTVDMSEIDAIDLSVVVEVFTQELLSSEDKLKITYQLEGTFGNVSPNIPLIEKIFWEPFTTLAGRNEFLDLLKETAQIADSENGESRSFAAFQNVQDIVVTTPSSDDTFSGTIQGEEEEFENKDVESKDEKDDNNELWIIFLVISLLCATVPFLVFQYRKKQSRYSEQTSP